MRRLKPGRRSTISGSRVSTANSGINPTMERIFKKCSSPFGSFNTSCGPGMNRRVDIAESPFVGGQLAVGVHVPLAQKKDELILGEIGIDERQGNTVKREVPRCVPRIFPFIRHGQNVFVVKMRPFLVAAVPALWGWRGDSRIAFKPSSNIVVIKLLGPEHS